MHIGSIHLKNKPHFQHIPHVKVANLHFGHQSCTLYPHYTSKIQAWQTAGILRVLWV